MLAACRVLQRACHGGGTSKEDDQDQAAPEPVDLLPLPGPLPKDEKIDTAHFLSALAHCQQDPAKAAILQETLAYLERVRADFPDYDRVRFRAKGFLEQGDLPPSQPDKPSSGPNKDAYSRTCNWVDRNLKTLQSLDMHRVMHC